MPKSSGLLRRKWLFFLFITLLLTAGAGSVFWLLAFPREVSVFFACLAGAQGFLLTYIASWSKARVEDSIAELRFENDRLQRRAFLYGFCFAACAFLYWFLPLHRSIWIKTPLILITGLFGAFTFFSLLIATLQGAELSGKIRHGFSERSLGSIVAAGVFCVGVVLLLVFNFLAGIQWWYASYVTADVRKQINQRQSLLKSIQLTHLYDGRGRYVGLHTKTESDWSRAYNDPKLLEWKISRAIQLAEGRVGKPAWWWRYLPDGENLKCEPFSIEAFLRVPYYMIKQRRKVGGSTPALQAAKNFLDFGMSRRHKGFLSTVNAKLFEEMPRAYVMCQAFSPRQMMSIYQATVWAGHKANYGLHRMALHYFGTGILSKLDWNQSVVLAASLPNPGRMNPWYLESCREGKCSSKRRARVYAVWRKRIDQLKQKLRRRGIKVPKELPEFNNGLEKFRAISQKWKAHDIHLRNWVLDDMSAQMRAWQKGAKVHVTYDRTLTIGKTKPPKETAPTDILKWKPKPNDRGLIHIAREYAKLYRQDIEGLQISYALIDARNGKVASQYGGDSDFDMSMARKPVFGSVFKVITLLVADQWPDALPLLNHGKALSRRAKCQTDLSACTQTRKFIYHPMKEGQGHWIRNSHKMPPYVDKKTALTISANIGFVFLSLRWTWFANHSVWMKALKQGLLQMFREKRKLSEAELQTKVDDLIRDPKRLRIELIRHFGYGRYLRNLRTQAVFEAAKASTIRSLLADATVDKKQLAVLLSRNLSDTLTDLDPKITKFLDVQKAAYTSRFQDELNLEQLSWSRELRMEIGLRYIIYLAQQIADYDPKRDHIKPVLSMTLGVNNSTTRQLASLASFYASKQVFRPFFVRSITKNKELLFQAKPKALPSPASPKAIETVRQAMNDVIRKGTAAQAGRLLKRRYDAKILDQAAAKTGTVQKTKGLSCIGYLGHRAGAVTLSTPNNDRLSVYRLRTSIRRKLKRFQRLYEYNLKKAREASVGSSRGRRRRRLARTYLRKLRKVQREAAKHKILRKQYYARRDKLKELDGKADRLLHQARRLRRSSRRHRAKARRLLARARRLQRSEKRIKKLVFRYYARRERSARYRKLHARTLKRYERIRAKRIRMMQTQLRENQRSLDSTRKAQQKQRAYALNRRLLRRLSLQHRRLSRRFFRGHQRWSLSSGKACLILFTLLSYWKDHPLPPSPTPDATLAAHTTPDTTTPASTEKASSEPQGAHESASTERTSADAAAPGEAQASSAPDARTTVIPEGKKTSPDAGASTEPSATPDAGRARRPDARALNPPDARAVTPPDTRKKPPARPKSALEKALENLRKENDARELKKFGGPKLRPVKPKTRKPNLKRFELTPLKPPKREKPDTR